MMDVYNFEEFVEVVTFDSEADPEIRNIRLLEHKNLHIDFPYVTIFIYIYTPVILHITTQYYCWITCIS